MHENLFPHQHQHLPFILQILENQNNYCRLSVFFIRVFTVKAATFCISLASLFIITWFI